MAPGKAAKGLVVHEDVDHLFLFWQGIQPVDEVLGAEAVLNETEGNLVAELEVAQQHFQLRVDGVGVHVVGALPTQDVLGTLGEHEVVAHVGHSSTDFIAINQLRVAEGLGCDAKHLFHLVLVGRHLTFELIRIRQRGQGMGVSLGEHLYPTRGNQFLEALQHLRCELFHLLDDHAREREREFDLVAELLDLAHQQFVHGQVALLSHTPHDHAVAVVVIIIMFLTDFEETIRAKPVRLMHLEIETD